MYSYLHACFQCIFSSMIPNWIYLLALANKLPANEPEAHNKIICYARQTRGSNNKGGTDEEGRRQGARGVGSWNKASAGQLWWTRPHTHTWATTRQPISNGNEQSPSLRPRPRRSARVIYQKRRCGFDLAGPSRSWLPADSSFPHSSLTWPGPSPAHVY